MRNAIRNFYVDYRSIFVGTIIAISLLIIAANVFYLWRIQLQSFLLDDKAEKLDFGRIGTLSAGLATIIGGAFALWRWTIDQRWRRVQYAQQLMKEFFEKPNTKLTLRMLDVMGEMQLPQEGDDDKAQWVTISEDMLIQSLQTLDQQQMFDEPYFSIRMIFDQFFTDLSMFQHHIDAKLIKLKDIRPYLEYWIKSINGYGQIYSIALARQINAFLKSFDYVAVLRLSQTMGYPLKRANSISNGADCG
jgi:hypothetical protein